MLTLAGRGQARGALHAVDGDAHLLTRARRKPARQRAAPHARRRQHRASPATRRPTGRSSRSRDTGPGIAAAGPAAPLHAALPRRDFAQPPHRRRRPGPDDRRAASCCAHGGDLAAANRPAGGAVFTGSLPPPEHASS